MLSTAPRTSLYGTRPAYFQAPMRRFGSTPESKPSYVQAWKFSEAWKASQDLQRYNSTLKNLKIGSHTRVIFQGFTGKQATANAIESLAWGTKVVGGVVPKREDEHLGLPVLPSVRKAMIQLQPDATGIYVAAEHAPAAIREAIRAEVPLIVAVTEHIPLHELLEIHAMLKTQSKSRLVGANSPGIISATGKCRIGFQPLSCYTPGCIGIVARSGTLSYEAAASTTRAGLGQSLCIGVGGDILPGTSLTDGLRVLVEDEDTEAIALIGELGGIAEIEAAEFIREYRQNTPDDLVKPIVALVAGDDNFKRSAKRRAVGHAGALHLPGEDDKSSFKMGKVEALESVGVHCIEHPSAFGGALRQHLQSRKRRQGQQQHRGFHMRAYRPACPVTSSAVTSQKRAIRLSKAATLDLLRQRNVPLGPAKVKVFGYLAVTVNRATRSPCVVWHALPWHMPPQCCDFQYHDGVPSRIVPYILMEIQRGGRPWGFYHLPDDDPVKIRELTAILDALVDIFRTTGAYAVSVKLTNLTQATADPDPDGSSPDRLIVLDSKKVGGNDAGGGAPSPTIGVDDAALRLLPASEELRADALEEVNGPWPTGAKSDIGNDGSAYINLQDPVDAGGNSHVCNIGTIVNGAGLAMNTVDALRHCGGRPTNFLDTGGKATSETVKRCFEAVLADERVKCIFVNIFGGLTLGDMIARGIVLAFQELQVTVPVVVRIRGTNEKEGQQIIAESGLPLYAFDSFAEAAAKAIDLADGEAKSERAKYLEKKAAEVGWDEACFGFP
ncbi:succinyl-CoA synthetase-like protein [Xylariomycetidae sp. FL0641]|nr:succinyl-CoA synthetase-like protein [Xylariomycetidae sp. FL0641]